MEKYVRCTRETCGLDIKFGKIYKVKNVLDSGGYELFGVCGLIHKCFMEDCTILDIDLQRVNNIVIGTLNYISNEFKGTEDIPVTTHEYISGLELYTVIIQVRKHNQGTSSSKSFDSAQEAQDYIDKFTKIIDDININHYKNKPKYKINSDKLYTEDEIVEMKELGIDFLEAK